MKIVKNEVKHYREAFVTISRFELEKIIANEAAKQTNFYGSKYKVEVKIVEESEGSPSYKVGYGAQVTIIEDLTKNEN